MRQPASAGAAAEFEKLCLVGNLMAGVLRCRSLHEATTHHGQRLGADAHPGHAGMCISRRLPLFSCLESQFFMHQWASGTVGVLDWSRVLLAGVPRHLEHLVSATGVGRIVDYLGILLIRHHCASLSCLQINTDLNLGIPCAAVSWVWWVPPSTR